MITRVLAPVSVNLYFNHKQRKSFPTSVLWEGKEYPILKIGLHHFYRKGRTLFHIFSAVSEGCFFKLVLNTETLGWEVEEVYTE